jgi:hypothetical protein
MSPNLCKERLSPSRRFLQRSIAASIAPDSLARNPDGLAAARALTTVKRIGKPDQ